MSGTTHTPLMQQYFQIKQGHKDALLLFQVGDFYELFFDDACKASAALGITLTARGKTKGEAIPLCGVPVHALDFYLQKLIKEGFKVAICDQVEPPKSGAIVARKVTRVLTPGTLVDETLLSAKSSSYLVAIATKNGKSAVVVCELLAGTIQATVLNGSSMRDLESELLRFSPDEILVSEDEFALKTRLEALKYPVSSVSCGNFQATLTLSYAVREDEYIVAQTALLKQALTLLGTYLNRTQQQQQIYRFSYYKRDCGLILDASTQHNLDLVTPSREGGKEHTLFAVLDEAVTPLGSRLLKKWILEPLSSEAQIKVRQSIVYSFIQNTVLRTELRTLLARCGDLERIVGRIALGRSTISDYLRLMAALEIMPQILYKVESLIQNNQELPPRGNSMEQCAKLSQLLRASLSEEHTMPWIIKPGFHARLDELRTLAHSAREKLLALELSEQQKTGINSLKIRHTDAFGYSIEITKTHSEKVPASYTRLQTLVGRERYTNAELQQLGSAIDRAASDVSIVENELFLQVQNTVLKQVAALRTVTQIIAYVDLLAAFAHTASTRSYSCPELNTSGTVEIIQGRHPIVERTISQRFVPNDLILSDEQFFLLLTGPNMGGKSTYLRQTALIALMTHIGSFVPARSANICILDRIFTRIGAGDNLAEGKSTFLVEMEEVAAICREGTERSLVILDEVGRGTSTSDGICIAQAIVEYLCEQKKPRALFATHYHELASLQQQYPVINSAHMESRKTETGVTFLYTVATGVSDGSFGIEVAQLAQLPEPIVRRARALLKEREQLRLSN